MWLVKRFVIWLRNWFCWQLHQWFEYGGKIKKDVRGNSMSITVVCYFKFRVSFALVMDICICKRIVLVHSHELTLFWSPPFLRRKTCFPALKTNTIGVRAVKVYWLVRHTEDHAPFTERTSAFFIISLKYFLSYD